MPIPRREFAQTVLPHVISATTPLAELLHYFNEQSGPQRWYAIIRLARDSFDILTIQDIAEIIDLSDVWQLSLPLAAIPGLLQPEQPAYRTQYNLDQAKRERARRTRRRLVVLEDNGQVAGILVSPNLTSKNTTILPTPSSAGQPLLRTRFAGRKGNAPLRLNHEELLLISIIAPGTADDSNPQPFTFRFHSPAEETTFRVRVDADPAAWDIHEREPLLIVAQPGVTRQVAVIGVTPRQAITDKLIISIEQQDGGVVQRVWMTVTAVDGMPRKESVPVIVERPMNNLPLDIGKIERPAVELLIEAGQHYSRLYISADLPGGRVHRPFTLKLSKKAIENATLRLRRELEKIVFYYDPQQSSRPYSNLSTFSINKQLAQRACFPLADAGWQVWELLFSPPGGEPDLRAFAEGLRSLAHGSRIRITLDDQEFILPWGLLYDKPGLLSEQDLDWSGFWGYRYLIEVISPGNYPAPEIAAQALTGLMLYNDDLSIRSYVEQQIAQLSKLLTTVAAQGHEAVISALLRPPPAAILYSYCHAEHHSGAKAPTELAGESALRYSGDRRMRVTDLRRMQMPALSARPLVFINACESATQQAFYYDGFMPYFIEQQLARGFIGTEVKMPTLLAHDFALQFFQRLLQGETVGSILWHLRRLYLEEHHNIMAFNYSLYGHGDIQVKTIHT